MNESESDFFLKHSLTHLKKNFKLEKFYRHSMKITKIHVFIKFTSKIRYYNSC